MLKNLKFIKSARPFKFSSSNLATYKQCESDFKPENYQVNSLNVNFCTMFFILSYLLLAKGPSIQDELSSRKNYFSKGLSLYYKHPIVINQGHRQWLWDTENKRYLDLFAGIVTVR